jgi:hypothetical protein
MKTILLTGLAIIASVVISTPSFAFHDSALDPAIKQQLAGAIDKLEDRCAAGDESACSLKEELYELGDDLADATEDCRAGDWPSCQTVKAVRDQLGRPGQAPAAPESGAPRPKPRSTTPAARKGGYADAATCQKAQVNYEKCMSEAREMLHANPPRFSTGSSLMATCKGFLDLYR